MASSPNVRPPRIAPLASMPSPLPPLTLLPLLPLLPPPPRPKIRIVWKRPNMWGSKCSINGYVRLGIFKTITAELQSVGDDTFREFRDSCLGHFIREEWGGFVSNAALHALFSNEVVRPDAQDQTRWESFPWGLYSYQILVTYLSDVPTEVPAGLDPGYHLHGNIYAIMIWACEAIPSLVSKCGIMLGASFIQRPRCTRWKLKKLGHIDFTTFFDDEIDSFEVLSPTPEEE
ncbi:hypothetical protein OROMI_007135 [Orobanche minor]